MKRRAAFVAIADDADDDEDIDKITAYCESCASFGFLHKLGPRVYPNKDQPIPYDADKWLQCPNCGQITPRVHAKQDNEIAPIVDPPKSIHDHNNVTVLSSNGGPAHRRSRAIIDSIKRTRPGASRAKDYVDVDLDLRAQLNSGSGKKLISYSSTNDEFSG
jgi:hypothetical protein